MVGNKSICPLCTQQQATPFYQDKSREYLRCGVCDLTFVPSCFHLSTEDEKAVYDQHQNSPNDQGYRRFLNRIFEPLQARLQPGSSGLDFGSGPGPTLSVMFSEAGHDVTIYDPYYAPNAEVLSQRYDFVTASEVVEHFCRPRLDFEHMWACVKPNGLLGVMTKRAGNLEAFANWHYKNDPTHISFFSEETFSWLAGRWNAELVIAGDDVVVFRRGDECPEHSKQPPDFGTVNKWSSEFRKTRETPDATQSAAAHVFMWLTVNGHLSGSTQRAAQRVADRHR